MLVSPENTEDNKPLLAGKGHTEGVKKLCYVDGLCNMKILVLSNELVPIEFPLWKD